MGWVPSLDYREDSERQIGKNVGGINRGQVPPRGMGPRIIGPRSSVRKIDEQNT